jgi:hypothetical protein
LSTGREVGSGVGGGIGITVVGVGVGIGVGVGVDKCFYDDSILTYYNEE